MEIASIDCALLAAEGLQLHRVSMVFLHVEGDGAKAL